MDEATKTEVRFVDHGTSTEPEVAFRGSRKYNANSENETRLSGFLSTVTPEIMSEMQRVFALDGHFGPSGTDQQSSGVFKSLLLGPNPEGLTVGGMTLAAGGSHLFVRSTHKLDFDSRP